MTSSSALFEVKGRGWINGFVNLCQKEIRRLWGTRTWFIQLLVWVLVLDGALMGELQTAQITGSAGELQGVAALEMFFTLAGLLPVVGVVILGQDALIEERKSGTAAWVFSKPVSRAAFLLAKMGAYALGVLVTMVLVPGGIAYSLYAANTGVSLSIPGFMAGMGLIYLLLLYFLALTLMLGVLFRSRGPVIGIPLALLFGANAAGSYWGSLVLPWALAMTLGPEKPALALRLALGQPLPSAAPIISTVLMAVLFTVVALVRFEREEF